MASSCVSSLYAGGKEGGVTAVAPPRQLTTSNSECDCSIPSFRGRSTFDVAFKRGISCSISTLILPACDLDPSKSTNSIDSPETFFPWPDLKTAASVPSVTDTAFFRLCVVGVRLFILRMDPRLVTVGDPRSVPSSCPSLSIFLLVFSSISFLTRLNHSAMARQRRQTLEVSRWSW